MEFLDKVYYGNAVMSWLMAVAVAAFIFAVLEIIRWAAARRLKAQAKKSPGLLGDSLLDVLEVRTKTISIAVFALYAGASLIVLPKRIAPFVSGIAVLAFAIQAGIWGNGLIAFMVENRRRKMMDEDPGSAGTYTAINFVARILLWSLILLLALDNLGINITTLVAGLGIGGIAGALALQNILGDLFASIAIVLDKPFQIGDFIVVDNYMGVVEHIGIKTTRIRSISGEQIVFANTDLLKSRVRNFKRMSERRVAFSIGVTYQTPSEKLSALPGIVREIIEGQELARFDRAHFKEFGDYSLNHEIVYYVKSADYNVYMDVQQKINLALYRRFNEVGIEFAYPTRTNYQISVKTDNKNS